MNALTLLGMGLLLAHCSCSPTAPAQATASASGSGGAGGGVTTPSSSGSGLASGASASSSSSSTSSTVSGAGGDVACPPIEEATTWRRGCEGIWRPVDFEGPECQLEVSDTPKLAVPPIEWEACWWGEGCHYMKKNWPSREGYLRDSSAPTVVPWGDGYRVGILQLWTPGSDWTVVYMRSVIYDETGTPLVAWRGTEGGCGPGIPQLTPTHVWLGTVTYPKMAMVFGDYDGIAHATEASVVEGGFQAIDGKDELFGSWAANGRTSSVYDRITKKTYTYGAGRDDVATTLPRIAGDGAFFRCAEGVIDAGACAWDRATGVFSMLIPPTATQVIPGVSSDGQRVVWFVATKPQRADNSWTKAEIWSSPFATTSAALQPTKIADSPPIDFPKLLVNGGYFAFAGSDWRVHVYRLSDMRHWETRSPVEEIGTQLEMVYIDSKTVWYMNAGLVVKQDLSALGPGEPG